MKTATPSTPKRASSPRPGVTVVENLPKAKPSPAMQTRMDEAKQLLREAKLPEGWRENPRLDEEYGEKVLFLEKVARANEFVKQHALPEE